jgi:hypothetical protein
MLSDVMRLLKLSVEAAVAVVVAPLHAVSRQSRARVCATLRERGSTARVVRFRRE